MDVLLPTVKQQLRMGCAGDDAPLTVLLQAALGPTAVAIEAAGVEATAGEVQRAWCATCLGASKDDRLDTAAAIALLLASSQLEVPFPPAATVADAFTAAWGEAT